MIPRDLLYQTRSIFFSHVGGQYMTNLMSVGILSVGGYVCMQSLG